MLDLTDLQVRGLAHVTYPVTVRQVVENAVASWRQFCTLPLDVKIKFEYRNEGNLDGAGYERKMGESATIDTKENFHVTLKALENLRVTASQVNRAEAFSFIFNAEDLVEYITPIIIEFAQTIGREFNLPELVDEVAASKHNWFFRYLHYFGADKAGDEIAKPHADKSGFTLHLYESAPGLQYLGYDLVQREWHEMPVSAGQTVIIPNVQLQYKTKGKLTALYHRVVATEETARTGRYSVVCFIPFLKTPLFNTKGKGRQQDLPVGYNYGMSHFMFSQFFE